MNDGEDDEEPTDPDNPEDETNPNADESGQNDWIEFQRFRARRNNQSPPSGSLMVFLADQGTSNFGGDAASMADLIIAHFHPSVECSRSDVAAWTSLFQWGFFTKTPTPFTTGVFCCLWLTRGRNGGTISCLESLFPVDGTPAHGGTHEIRFLSKTGADQESSGPLCQLPRILRIIDSGSGGIGKLFPEEIAAFGENYPERIVGVPRKIMLVFKRLFAGKAPPEGYEDASKELERFLPHFLYSLAKQVAGYFENPLIVPVWRFICERRGAKGTKASEAEIRKWLESVGIIHPQSEDLLEAMEDCGCLPPKPGCRPYHKRWPRLREAVLRHRETEFGIPRRRNPPQGPGEWLPPGTDLIGPES